MNKIKRFIGLKILKHKREKFCKLNNYYCPDCIYHNWIWDKDGVTFRGNDCMFGKKSK